MSFLTKTKDQILSSALRKVVTTTPITSVGPGSVARSIIEAVTTEIGDLYSVIDLNISSNVISTAQGQALDHIGALYALPRKTLSDVATMDKSLGVFYFYLDSPASINITIPVGTRIFTNIDSYVGRQFVYSTTENIILPSGRVRAYASIRPVFSDSIFTAGIGTLTVLDPNFVQPQGVTLRCTNPKPVVAQVGFEPDDDYRLRIIKAVRTTAGGTLEAVRFAGLSISGVRDIKMRDTPFGLGSFEAIVVPEDNSIKDGILAAVAIAMNNVRPVGVSMSVRLPDVLPVQIKASIIIKDSVNVDTTTVLNKIRIGIMRYLNTFLVGTPLIYSQLIQAILDATDVVSDVKITSLAVGGSEILRQNYSPDSDQQLIPGNIVVDIAT